MKFLLIIGDGMADDPVAELDGKTPLQYSNIPETDRLASTGIIGNVLTVPDGMSAGSDTAILSIFGCDPQSMFFGRAPLEAAALGIKLSQGDIALRCNMISIEDSDASDASDVSGASFEYKKILSHSGGSVSGAESDTLICDLFESPEFKEAATQAGIVIYPGNSFRHIAVMAPGARHEDAAQTDISVELTPPHDHLGEALGQYLPKGDHCAVLDRLIRISHEFLNDHPINIKRRSEGKLPANCIWFWAQGVACELPNFTERYGKTGSVISAVPLCQGIGVLIGLNKIVVEGATGELYTNYEGKVEAALKELETHDFVTVHIEAPDECTHNGDIRGKIQAIEWIDSRVIAPLMKRLHESGEDFRVLVMSDHRTLLSTRGHAGGPVPFVIYDSRDFGNRKIEMTFCEADAVRGLYIGKGTELLKMLFG